MQSTWENLKIFYRKIQGNNAILHIKQSAALSHSTRNVSKIRRKVEKGES